jgi:hypothetical protein
MTKRTNRNARKSAPKTTYATTDAGVAVETEARELGHSEPSIVAEVAIADATVEAPAAETPAEAPAADATPAPAAEKVSWEDTMKKAQMSFAKTGAFREGTNRAVLYPLLNREEGVSLTEALNATLARGGKLRQQSSIHTDLHDIAKITQRKLTRCDAGEVKRYRLAPIEAPKSEAPAAETNEEAK